MAGRLSSKRALVTAAGQGIGRASAIAMAAEGADVTATDINPKLMESLRSEAHPRLQTIVLDVRDLDAVSEVIASSKPDVLFNCAGIVHVGSIVETSDAEWQDALDLNVTSMMRIMRAALPGMIERGGGSIINMASVLSSVYGAPNRFAYTASKAAVVGMTKSVAADFVGQGIRVNAIAPATVDTPSLHDRLRATGDYNAAMEAFIARQPIGRIATVDELAALVVYLASDESSYTTGQVHVIDGGMSSF